MPAIRALFVVIESNPGITFGEARSRAGLGFDDSIDALLALARQHRIRRHGSGWIA